MIHCPTTTATSDPRDTSLARYAQVHFLPRILIPAYDNARVIPIQEQQRFFRMLMPKQPGVFESAAVLQWLDLQTYQSSSERLKYGFVEFDT